jgi:hypothetical protein
MARGPICSEQHMSKCGGSAPARWAFARCIQPTQTHSAGSPPLAPRQRPQSRVTQSSALVCPLGVHNRLHSPGFYDQHHQLTIVTHPSQCVLRNLRGQGVRLARVGPAGDEEILDAEELFVQIVVDHVHVLLWLERAGDAINLAREICVGHGEGRFPYLRR